MSLHRYCFSCRYLTYLVSHDLWKRQLFCWASKILLSLCLPKLECYRRDCVEQQWHCSPTKENSWNCFLYLMTWNDDEHWSSLYTLVNFLYIDHVSTDNLVYSHKTTMVSIVHLAAVLSRHWAQPRYKIFLLDISCLMYLCILYFLSTVFSAFGCSSFT